jgi:hypothetical protein
LKALCADNASGDLPNLAFCTRLAFTSPRSLSCRVRTWRRLGRLALALAMGASGSAALRLPRAPRHRGTKAPGRRLELAKRGGQRAKRSFVGQCSLKNRSEDCPKISGSHPWIDV